MSKRIIARIFTAKYVISAVEPAGPNYHAEVAVLDRASWDSGDMTLVCSEKCGQALCGHQEDYRFTGKYQQREALAEAFKLADKYANAEQPVTHYEGWALNAAMDENSGPLSESETRAAMLDMVNRFCQWCGERANGQNSGATYKLDKQEDGAWCCRWESCEEAQRKHDEMDAAMRQALPASHPRHLPS